MINCPAGQDFPERVRISGTRRQIFERCVGCGRCYISCMDGGHQAIEFDPGTRRPKLNWRKCVGCHLCRLVCSTGAIGTARKAVRRNQEQEPA